MKDGIKHSASTDDGAVDAMDSSCASILSSADTTRMLFGLPVLVYVRDNEG